jgi:hypothetical protein
MLDLISGVDTLEYIRRVSLRGVEREGKHSNFVGAFQHTNLSFLIFYNLITIKKFNNFLNF